MSGCLVCGVDDSRGAREAVRVAATLSEQLGLPLVLLHVAQLTRSIHARGLPYGHGELHEEELREAGRVLTEVAQEYELQGLAEPLVRIGDPASHLADVAREQSAAMLVVGSRGRGALTSALLGSVSARLAAEAPCPVVVVPQKRDSSRREDAR
jgi:nucleotide-binding universal stress UspA family protein